MVPRDNTAQVELTRLLPFQQNSSPFQAPRGATASGFQGQQGSSWAEKTREGSTFSSPRSAPSVSRFTVLSVSNVLASHADSSSDSAATQGQHRVNTGSSQGQRRGIAGSSQDQCRGIAGSTQGQHRRVKHTATLRLVLNCKKVLDTGSRSLDWSRRGTAAWGARSRPPARTWRPSTATWGRCG